MTTVADVVDEERYKALCEEWAATQGAHLDLQPDHWYIRKDWTDEVVEMPDPVLQSIIERSRR